LEIHLAFIDYLKALTELQREKIFYISESKNISNLLLNKNNRNLFWKQNKDNQL